MDSWAVVLRARRRRLRAILLAPRELKDNRAPRQVRERAEGWLTDAGVIRARRWLPGQRMYPWRELTGVRLAGPESEEPPRLELVGFTKAGAGVG